MKPGKNPGENSNRVKDPDDWVTGDEEMTGAQESYLHTLDEEAHEPVEPDLTKAAASKEIDRLQAKTGRGVKSSRGRNASRRRKQRQAEADKRQEHEDHEERDGPIFQEFEEMTPEKRPQDLAATAPGYASRPSNMAVISRCYAAGATRYRRRRPVVHLCATGRTGSGVD
ncbi:MAG TPA: DUF3072 domain-containing protein [Stellaceae bacterium]